MPNNQTLRHGTVTMTCRWRDDFVSILKALVRELQQRVEFGVAVPSTGEVADAASSDRINVTLPRGVMDDLKRHALAEGRSCGNLASYLIEDGLRHHAVISQPADLPPKEHR